MQAARIRIRELEAHGKMTKRELRRARKTVKTFEAMATLKALQQPAAAAVQRPDSAPMQSAIVSKLERKNLGYFTMRGGGDVG